MGELLVGGGTLGVSFFPIPPEASVATTYWGSVTELAEVVALAERGVLDIHVERFPLDDAMTAYERLERGEAATRQSCYIGQCPSKKVYASNQEVPMTQAMSTLDTAGPLTGDNRGMVAERLQATLVDLIAVSLLAKQVHWNVTGPRFIGLHERLDEIVELARTYADTVAERSAAIGVPPSGQVHTVAADNRVTPIADGWISDDDTVNVLIDRLSTFAERVKDRASDVRDADVVAENILVDLVGDLEKHAWMLRASR